MTVLMKIAESLDNTLELVLGKGVKYSTEQVLKKYPSTYVYYILTSRS